jgi:Skp family chaperone for outer membrane proteins
VNLKTSALLVVANVLLSALIVLAYALWFAPAAAPRLAVLDVGELYRLKETQVAKVLVKLDATHEDRALALQRASAFGLEMTNLIQSLPEECHCLILARGAVVGPAPLLPDLTPEVRRRLGL